MKPRLPTYPQNRNLRRRDEASKNSKKDIVHRTASDQGVVKLLYLWKLNIPKEKCNKLPGAESAVRQDAARDAMVDKVVSSTLAVTGIIGTVLSFTPFAPIGLSMVGASALGMAAWKSFRGSYEGGEAGAAAGIASAGINYALNKASLGAVSVNLSYSYAGGFGAGVSYNEKSGFGVSAGVSLMYTENFGKGDVRGSHGWQAQVGPLEVNYDNLSGYSASLQAASAMFGDTPLKMTSSLTWSEQNGFNGSVSYNILNEEQMAKEAAKGAQKNQGNLFLNIMDGLGYNLGGREGEPTLLDNITGAFSGAWNTIKGVGNWIGNTASSAFNSVSNFVSNAYNKLFGPKQYVMMPVMEGMGGQSPGGGVSMTLPGRR
ncbi:hypothetical protein M5D10_04030 [Leptospira santarosai]|uniref:hypothetical protein n=1 Tax=Leptospira santarosai TaxID=28183 RepID=UPI0022A954F0|nr:hypothetical protein [Leptospira santarosai]UZN08152.1 hypothetical protein M5D10_04030 [Leptospira santarosai]